MKNLTIYLDIDGVLNNAGAFVAQDYIEEKQPSVGYNVISRDNLGCFLHLVRKTDANVYIHSSWRRSKSRNQIVDVLRREIDTNYDFIVENVPRFNMNSDICHDIHAHMEANGLFETPVLILDDMPTRFPKEWPLYNFWDRYYLRTDPMVGFTMPDLWKASKMLKDHFKFDYTPPMVML